MKNRRKTLLVNAVEQRRFILGAVLTTIILINLAVISSVIFNPSLLDAVEFNHIIFLASVETVIVIGIAYFSLLISHKIVGPAYALARDLKRLADGDLTVEIHLRNGDFHTDAANALNYTAEMLRTRMTVIKSELAKLEARRNIDEDTRKTVEQLLEDLAYFKTEPGVNAGQAAFDAHGATRGPSEGLADMNVPHVGR